MKTLNYKTMMIAIFLIASSLASCGSDNDSINDQNNNILTPDVELNIKEGNDLYGKITDSQNNGIENVVVTDGYNNVLTDSKGVYQMKRNQSAKFVSYTNPANYKANSSKFFRSLSSATTRYDFSLEKEESDNSHFYLLVIGDPQVRGNSSISRFQNETMSQIRSFLGNTDVQVIGLSMGDNVHEGYSEYENRMFKLLNGTSMPVFSAVGNHDYFVQNRDSSVPRSCDAYEKVFGPTYYSFNKGNVHFIALNNVSYSDGSNYKGAFSDAQISWMKQDLSNVSKNCMIVVYYHIPIRDDQDFANRDAMLNLLSEFPNKILMCGHTHYMRNYVTKSPIQVEERIQAAACGAFWHSTINGDGTPNGYSVYEIKDNSIINNWYQSIQHPSSYQIRLLHGNGVFGGTYGSYTYGLSSDYIVANIWNWDSQWKVYCYEDGIYSGEMTNSLSYFKTDAWAQGYHIGVLQRAKADFSQYTMHDFVYKLKNPNAKVKVIAVDRFGNEYSQETFTTDFSEAIGYKY